MNRTNICKNIVQSIKDYITDQVKLEPHRVEKHFVRRRKLSLLQVIIYLFFSSKASMFQNLSQIREELGTLSFPDVSKQALSKARQFINPSLFKELYYLSVDLFYSQIPSRKLWQGYHLFAVDGSRIELPNSKSTFDFFGEMSSYLGNRSLRVQSDEAASAKIFVEFVALIVRSRMYVLLKDEMEKLDKKPKYMTVPAAIRELEKIELVRQTDGKYRMDHAVTATQKIILKAFDMNADQIQDKAAGLSRLLEKYAEEGK